MGNKCVLNRVLGNLKRICDSSFNHFVNSVVNAWFIPIKIVDILLLNKILLLLLLHTQVWFSVVFITFLKVFECFRSLKLKIVFLIYFCVLIFESLIEMGHPLIFVKFVLLWTIFAFLYQRQRLVKSFQKVKTIFLGFGLRQSFLKLGSNISQKLQRAYLFGFVVPLDLNLDLSMQKDE